MTPQEVYTDGFSGGVYTTGVFLIPSNENLQDEKGKQQTFNAPQEARPGGSQTQDLGGKAGFPWHWEQLEKVSLLKVWQR